MTIQRIHRDERYLTFSVPTSEVLTKLGREYPFHISRAPVPYAGVWKEPLAVRFAAGEEAEGEVVPDLEVRWGRLFFSEKAHEALNVDLKQDGEFLPVVYEGGTGYIFNPLTVAEDHDALDEKATARNEYGDLESLGFIEEKLPAGTMVFRTEADTYNGVFCTDAFKRAVEDAGLVGVYFQPDLANIFGYSAAPKH